MSDTMRMISRSVAEFAGGSSPMYRWDDVLSGNVDTRTADEIVNDVIKNAGLEVIE